MNRSVLIATTALAFAGCSRTPSAKSSEAQAEEQAKAQTFLAFSEPCSLEKQPDSVLPADAPEPPPAVQPEAPFKPGVFFDVALFLLPTARAHERLPASRESLTRDPAVRLLGTPHLFAPLDATSRTVLEDHTGPLAEATLHELAATPTRTGDRRIALELDAALLLPTPPTAVARPAESRVHFVAAPYFGQAVASREPIPGAPGQSLLLLLTPYDVRAESDFRAIFQCKMAQRSRALSSRR